MKKFWKEFKTFAFKGNMMDMAIGIIIGAAFGKIITSLVNDIIMPPIGVLIGGVNFKDLSVIIKKETLDMAGNVIPAVTLNYGNFVQVLIDFLLVAIVVFLVIKGLNRLGEMTAKALHGKEEAPEEEAQPAEPAPTKEETLLTEIRDILKDTKSA